MYRERRRRRTLTAARAWRSARGAAWRSRRINNNNGAQRITPHICARIAPLSCARSRTPDVTRYRASGAAGATHTWPRLIGLIALCNACRRAPAACLAPPARAAAPRSFAAHALPRRHHLTGVSMLAGAGAPYMARAFSGWSGCCRFIITPCTARSPACIFWRPRY